MEIQERITCLVKDKKINIIICIDEAQYLKTDIINDLKILLNFEMDSKNYISLILMGQPILNTLLSRNIHEALKQRIAINYNFTGLSKEEMVEYIDSRFKIAKANTNPFSENSYETLYNSCNSSLRVLNNIIIKCLIIASNKQINSIDSDIILEAYNDMQLL